MLAKRSAKAHLQSDFYSIQYHKLLRILIVLVFILFFLIAGIIYSIFAEPPRVFYGNTVEGMILPMPAVLKS